MSGNKINYGKSIRSRLLNVSRKESVYYQTILTRYFQERLLYRMSLTRFRSNFYLKGGVLMYAYERFPARPTLDIDFLGCNISNDGDDLIHVFQEICAVLCEEDGVNYDIAHITAQNITEFKSYHGVRLSIPVTMDTISQVMTMDIGFGDVVTPSPVALDYPLLLDSLPAANIMAYSIETVIAEKMHAVVDLADQNSRMKDYYDLYHILSNENYNQLVLQEAVERTFENRHTSYSAITMFFQEGFPENTQMQVKWKAFVRKITGKTELTFNDVASYLQITLKPYWEHLNLKERREGEGELEELKKL
jgi:predicted nucleotidyltransferase component of viral defense system